MMSQTGENKKTILVIDDDEGCRRIIALYLEKWGFNAIEANCAEKALPEIEICRPDLIITDIRMPGMNGFELIDYIKRIGLSIPIIIMTGVLPESAVYAIRCGAYAYIEKPVKPNVLQNILNEFFSIDKNKIERHYLKKHISFLCNQIETLENKINQLDQKPESQLKETNAEVYRTICGAFAHSLRSEFLIIGNSIREIRESAGALPDLQNECLMIERSVDYSQVLLRRLLDYLDTGQPQMGSIEVSEILKKIETLVRPRLSSNVKLEISEGSIVGRRAITANLEQLIGVLLELIQNASTALRHKGGTINLEVLERDSGVAIVVKDDGPGIPVELVRKILNEQVPSKDGLGIGLFLCKKVVSGLGGKLELETSSEMGTTFTILFPTITDKRKA